MHAPGFLWSLQLQCAVADAEFGIGCDDVDAVGLDAHILTRLAYPHWSSPLQHGCLELQGASGSVGIGFFRHRAGIPASTLLDTLQQVLEPWPELRYQQSIDPASSQVVRCNAEVFCGSQITLNDAAIASNEQVDQGSTTEKRTVVVELLLQCRFVGGDLLVLQVELHLMHLEFMQELESIFRGFGIAGQAVQQAQGVDSHCPMGCGGRGAGLQSRACLVAQLCIGSGFISEF